MVEELKIEGDGYSGKIAVNCVFCGARVETAVAGQPAENIWEAATGDVPAAFGKESEVTTAAGQRLDIVDLRVKCPGCNQHFPVKAQALS